MNKTIKLLAILFVFSLLITSISGCVAAPTETVGQNGQPGQSNPPSSPVKGSADNDMPPAPPSG